LIVALALSRPRCVTPAWLLLPIELMVAWIAIVPLPLSCTMLPALLLPFCMMSAVAFPTCVLWSMLAVLPLPVWSIDASLLPANAAPP